MSSYIVYGVPREKTGIGDVKLIAEFQSEKEKNFQILISCKKCSRGRNKIKVEEIYYMLLEGDMYPVFITKAQVNTFIVDFEKAKEFIYNVWMNRYR